MKRNICLFMVCLIVFCFSGCKEKTINKEENVNVATEVSETDTTQQELAISKDKDNIEFVSENYEFRENKLVYPQIVDDSSKLNKCINSVIFEEAVKLASYFDISSEFSLEMDYEISIYKNKILSVVYICSAFSDEVIRPINIVYTTNIDLLTGKRVQLCDVVEINNDLVSVIKSDNIIFDNNEIRKQIHAISDDKFIQILKLSDDTDGVNYKNNPPVAYSYYDDEFINIVLFDDSFDVDYIEIKIPINVASNLIKR